MVVEQARITLRSRREIDLIHAAGQVVHEVLQALEQMVAPGVSTAELNAQADEIIRRHGATALFKGVENPAAKFPFPASICASVNEVVVHGVPSTQPLVEGDIVSVDCGVRLKGYCGDAARTFAVGQVDPRARELLNVTAEALAIAEREIRPGRRWSEVARSMQACVEQHGFGVVRDFVGHGIGQQMHEEPKIPNYYDRSQRGSDFELQPGMVLAVEPMVTLGHYAVEPGDETGWPMVTRDRSLAAHFENDIAVTESGARVLSDGSGPPTREDQA